MWLHKHTSWGHYWVVVTTEIKAALSGLAYHQKKCSWSLSVGRNQGLKSFILLEDGWNTSSEWLWLWKGQLSARVSQSITKVACTMEVQKSAISQLSKATVFRGTLMLVHGEGNGRSTAAQEGPYIAQLMKRNRFDTPVQIPSDLASASGTHVSSRTTSQWTEKFWVICSEAS